MALDPTEVRVGTTGHLYRAAPGTAFPTDHSELAPAYKELGYMEAGPTKSVDTSKERFIPWQSRVAVRETITEQTITWAYTLWQRNGETLREAWGGGTITAGTGDLRIFRPPAEASLREGIYVLDVIDGDIMDRYLLKRASASLGGEVAIQKNAVTGYAIELTALAAPDGGSPWELITNDEAVEVDA